MQPITSIFDLQERARKRLPKLIYDYVCGGSEQELTLRRNIDDLQALAFLQHTMRDVSNRHTAVEMVGDHARIPLAIAPIGLAGLTWANGECDAAAAASAFGVPYCLSTMSISPIEEVAAASARPLWFQLYLMKRREVNENLIRRAHDAGCSALVLTVDLHVQGKRWADAKNGLTVPPRPTLANMTDLLRHPRWLVGMLRSRHRTFGNLEKEVGKASNVAALSQWIEDQFDPSFNVDSVKWVRSLWDRKLILKGILHTDDARLAIDVGADALVVSNHGGRQLDGSPSSISVLPGIAAAVGGQIEVLFDGGIRTGGDIVKAMARGADGCLSGRACVFGLAAMGGPGVTCALKLLQEQLDDCMALLGVNDVRHVDGGAVTSTRGV